MSMTTATRAMAEKETAVAMAHSSNNGNGNSNGDNAAAIANGNNVNDNDSGNSRMETRQWQLDNNDGTTTMWWQWAASNIQNACKYCATHPRQQSTNVDSLGRRRQERGAFEGIEPQKRVKVQLIKWISIHLHSTDSKSTFCPSQSRNSTGTYFACILGVRLHYQHHGKHVYWLWKRGRLGVSHSVGPERGFGPSIFYLDFHSVLIKI